MYVRGNPVLLVDPNGMSDEPFGIGTRFSNWIKGDGWKNKANKFIAKNNLTSKTNSDGSISAHDAESWQRLNETGAESGLNTLDYTFTEDGYSLTTNSSATHNETTQSFSYNTLSTSNSGNVMNWVQGGLDVVGLIPGIGEIADGLNAAIYLARGDKVNAALSAVAMIPLVGWAATGTKAARNAMKAAKFTGDQTALLQMAKTAKKTGATIDEAKILKEWAKEYNLPYRGPEIHPDRNYNKPHIHIGPVNHIPIK